MIVEKLEVGSFATNCYIVGSESTKEGVIIDPGAEAKRILKKVRDSGLSIKLIVLTHGHIDHIAALKEVKTATGVEIAIHSADAALFKGDAVSKMFGFSAPSLPPPDRMLGDGDKIDIADLHFSVLHTPGHTQGAICLLERGIVFTGDTLFNMGIGRYDLPGGDGEQLLESISSKLMALPDDTMVFPGHGPDTTIGSERHNNPFLR